MRSDNMEVVNPKSAVLSNYEVLSLLKELQAQYSEKGQKKLNTNQHLATISYETTLYLENTPCKLQNEDVIKRFMLALSPYKLTRAEKLQLLNHRPSTAVEIQLMIEESEERLTEQEIDSLLTIIAEILPGENEEEEPEEQLMEADQT